MKILRDPKTDSKKFVKNFSHLNTTTSLFYITLKKLIKIFAYSKLTFIYIL